MRCLSCARLSLAVLCQGCLDSIPLRPSVRKVEGVPIYCFFGYDDVSFLLNAKYYTIGSRILARLSDKAARYFATHSDLEALSSLSLIGIDDYVRSFYSHTGVIIRTFSKRTGLRPVYGELRARNHVSYAGKPLAYRLANRRDFAYSAGSRPLAIADDIITTGTSFREAIGVCKQAGASIHFGLALCNAQI